MKGGLPMDGAGECGSPLTLQLEALTDRHVELCCLRDGATCTESADGKAALRDFLLGNVFSLLALRNDCHARPGEVVAVSPHSGFVHCQMGCRTERSLCLRTCDVEEVD